MNELILATQKANMGFMNVFTGFVLCLLCSIAVAYIYGENRRSVQLELSSLLLIFVALVTFLIVVVIQDSLMLSLGMVGALSIVRFRSPIKNTLDLGYIFFAVAIGVGFASGKLLLTLLITCSISVLLFAAIKVRGMNIKRFYEKDESKSIKVWIFSLEHLSDNTDDLFKLVDETSPDGFSCRDKSIELRFTCTSAKAGAVKDIITRSKLFRIEALNSY